MHVYLETDRLVLRRFTAADADLLIELDSDPPVLRYLSTSPTPPETVRERVLPIILAGYEMWDGKFGVFAAQHKDTGAFLGWFFLRPEDGTTTDEVELGYRLRRDEWGKGYATEGSRALIDRAFTELKVHTVWADTMAVNRPSRNVLEKLGMTLTGTIDTPPDLADVEGAEHGGVRYEISTRP
ncbi:GNAT family N-acetyltransferase [Cryptosporangium phraense]|uniref:GNAT family N-acetyltransferase n=1 Tax=Cryptosporangium phraense TaxID=2593070 RepID=A0A545AV70_9ACTN|nr:GNAT family N-acetyltransferase [Cryptosporangium phraense]TQS45226.1 GNAT family N-acetyltransferase [Cryptosporangium phraense]